MRYPIGTILVQIFLVGVFLIFSFRSTGQGSIIQSDQYEIPVRDSYSAYEVVPAGENGVFLFQRLAAKSKDVIKVIFLDTALQEVWKGFIPVEKDHGTIKKYFYRQSLYLLSRSVDLRNKDFTLTAVNCTTKDFIVYTCKNFIPFDPTEFYVTDKGALFGGYFSKTPVVVYYSFATGTSKVLPGLFNETGELTQVKPYPDGTFDVLISGRNFERKKTIWIRNYDDEGNLIKNIMLDPGERKSLLFGRSLKLHDDMQLVAGTYGTTASEFSRGIFISSIDPLGNQKTSYYSYANLENFFKYMRAKREKRIKERIERRKIKGRKLRYNYRFIVHEIVPYQNQYVLLGEAFYPKYTSVSRPAYGGSFSRNYGLWQNAYVFDGYYYTHAVVIGFDSLGRALWDNSFEINDVKTFALEQFVKIDADSDKMTLLYFFENEIRSKIIRNNTVLEGKSAEPIKPKSTNPLLKQQDIRFGKMDYWYKNYFCAYGVRELTRQQESQSVFFINKVSTR